MSSTTPPPPDAGGPRTAIQREVEADYDTDVPGTTVVEHFGRKWRVPIKRHFRHLQAMRNGMVSGFGNYDLLIAEVFLDHRLFEGLPAGQVKELWDLNPTEEELAEFTKVLAQALGMEEVGN